jgi:antitoxin YefM
METTSFSDFRSKLKQKLDNISDNHDLLVVTRKDNKDVVVMSLADYNSIQETLYLLSSRTNAKRLYESMEQLKGKKVIRKKVKEL